MVCQFSVYGRIAVHIFLNPFSFLHIYKVIIPKITNFTTNSVNISKNELGSRLL